MRLPRAALEQAPVCGNCYDYVDDCKIVRRKRGWVHVANNSRRCPGQGDDDTDDRAYPLTRHRRVITDLAEARGVEAGGPVAGRHVAFRVHWSEEDEEYVATCPDFPSLSWLAPGPVEALKGLLGVIRYIE